MGKFNQLSIEMYYCDLFMQVKYDVKIGGDVNMLLDLVVLHTDVH